MKVVGVQIPPPAPDSFVLPLLPSLFSLFLLPLPFFSLRFSSLFSFFLAFFHLFLSLIFSISLSYTYLVPSPLSFARRSVRCYLLPFPFPSLLTSYHLIFISYIYSYFSFFFLLFSYISSPIISFYFLLLYLSPSLIFLSPFSFSSFFSFSSSLSFSFFSSFLLFFFSLFPSSLSLFSSLTVIPGLAFAAGLTPSVEASCRRAAAPGLHGICQDRLEAWTGSSGVLTHRNYRRLNLECR